MSNQATFHQSLIEKLRGLVRKGKFTPGAKFLTEREIAQRFATSRPTANKALSSLVSEGVLQVRRGAGTFVRERGLDYDLERLVSFTDKARVAGKKPGTVLEEYRKVRASEAPEAVATGLRVSGDAVLIYMERIRLADEVPVILEHRYVVADLCQAMTRRDAKGSLYECWTKKCGLTITGADETIHAITAPKAIAAKLGIASGAACFQITATGHVSNDKPLWHEVTVYRADVYEFRNRINGLGQSRAALGHLKD